MSTLPFGKAEAGHAADEPSPGVRFGPAAASGRPGVAIPGVVPASRLEVRPAPEVVSTGIASVDALAGGLPRGALTEILGTASSGRTSLLVSVLATLTAHGELCALVDASDSFAPETAQAAGVNLEQLLWVRCVSPVASDQWSGARKTVASGEWRVASRTGVTRNLKLETRNVKRETWARIEQALKATDLLLQSGGFGLVAVDLGDIPPQAARRVPLTSWFRFRRAVENTPTVLLLLARESCAKTCASLVLQLRRINSDPGSGRRPENKFQVSSFEFRVAGNGEDRLRAPSHAELLTGISVEAELVRTRGERKPVRAVSADFETRAEWA